MWHCFRLVADEQSLKITTAIHFIGFDFTVAKFMVFMILCNTSFLDANYFSIDIKPKRLYCIVIITSFSTLFYF